MSSPWTVVRLRAEATDDEGWRGDDCRCGTVLDAAGNPIPHGEPLWPERWPCTALHAMKTANATVWESSYQQEPTVGGGFWFAASPPQYYHEIRSSDFNVYLLCDPALSKNRKADRTTIGAIGLGFDQNFYLLDLVWDRLSPSERADHIFRLHRKWRPVRMGYEEYGMQSDSVELQNRMERENYRFTITPLGRTGSWHNLSKGDRISTLVPQVQSGRWWLPNPDVPGRDPAVADWTRRLIAEEWNRYPASTHDDVLDMLSRINDPEFKASFPRSHRMVLNKGDTPVVNRSGTSWMSA